MYPVKVFLALRGMMTAWAVLVTWWFPPDVSQMEPYYMGMPPAADPILGPWQRWDTLWYLRIAQRGYQARADAAFFPLYPLLVRWLGMLLGGRHLLAALIISNAACLGALVLLHHLAVRHLGHAASRRAVLYMAAFPTTFFLLAGYTEPVFLLLVLGAFLAAEEGRWPLAGLLGGLAALTRPPGVLLIIPLAVEWVRQRGRPAIWAALLPVPLGLALYSGYLGLRFGDPLLWAHVQSLSPWGRWWAWPWETLGAAIRGLAAPWGHNLGNVVLDLAVTLLFLALTAVATQHLPPGYALYMGAVLLLPLFTLQPGNPLYSMSRLALAAFPGFLVLGKWGRDPRVHRLILYPSLGLQLLLSALFFRWFFVS